MPPAPRPLPHLSVATIGHVQEGKTTLTAALTRVMHGQPRTPEQLHDPGERFYGHTTFGHCIEYASERRRYTHWDSPGHADFGKNTIKILAQVDAAILVVSAAAGPGAQTREHLEYARAFGLEHVVVFLGHCDILDAPELLDMVERDTRELLTDCGFDGDATPVIRGSALRALEHGELEPLHALRAALDAIPQPARDLAGPLVLPVHRRFYRWWGRQSARERLSAPDRSTIVAGRVERGTLRTGATVELLGLLEPRRGPALQVRIFDRIVTTIGAGDHGGCQIGQDPPWEVIPGQVLALAGTLTVHSELHARIVLSPPPKRRSSGPPKSIRSGYRPQLYVRTADVTATLSLTDVERAYPGDIVSAIVTLDAPIVLTGARSFILRDSSYTIGVGTILELIR